MLMSRCQLIRSRIVRVSLNCGYYLYKLVTMLVTLKKYEEYLYFSYHYFLSQLLFDWIFVRRSSKVKHTTIMAIVSDCIDRLT